MEAYKTLLAIGYTLLLLDVFSLVIYRSPATLFPQIVVLILSTFMIVYAIIQIRNLK
ncbi:MAG: hypothetical protein QXY87_12740 [Saccharolobus sp.]|uniref:hypothetical protein n=1 Tax=Saccharolobus TaxID=2100760 RepID=UPI001C437933|nr:hypothetical protein [Saccharolobus shibatae]MCH4816103.1 hypothetical protein [Saccharolobus shibatae]